LVVALAVLPAAGSLVGALGAETVEVPDRALSIALHLAAGIVLAVVGLELMPEALAAHPPWVAIASFVAGGAAFIGLDRFVGLHPGEHGCAGAIDRSARDLRRSLRRLVQGRRHDRHGNLVTLR
jgi:hypothetical protein